MSQSSGAEFYVRQLLTPCSSEKAQELSESLKCGMEHLKIGLLTALGRINLGFLFQPLRTIECVPLTVPQRKKNISRNKEMALLAGVNVLHEGSLGSIQHHMS